MPRARLAGAIVPGAGSARRMGGDDKLFLPLGGKASLHWVLEALLAEPRLAQIVVATSAAKLERVHALLALLGDSRLLACLGGPTRQASVQAALGALDPALDLVLIHDAARPLLSGDVIRRGLAAGASSGAAVAAIPVSDTIKRVGPDGVVRATLPREELVAVQTPQVFRRDWLLTAYERAGNLAVTDEAGLLEAAGFPVETYAGDEANLKLTHPIDLALAEALLRARQSKQGAR